MTAGIGRQLVQGTGRGQFGQDDYGRAARTGTGELEHDSQNSTAGTVNLYRSACTDLSVQSVNLDDSTKCKGNITRSDDYINVII